MPAVVGWPLRPGARAPGSSPSPLPFALRGGGWLLPQLLHHLPGGPAVGLFEDLVLEEAPKFIPRLTAPGLIERHAQDVEDVAVEDPEVAGLLLFLPYQVGGPVGAVHDFKRR